MMVSIGITLSGFLCAGTSILTWRILSSPRKSVNSVVSFFLPTKVLPAVRKAIRFQRWNARLTVRSSILDSSSAPGSLGMENYSGRCLGLLVRSSSPHPSLGMADRCHQQY